MRTTQRLAYLGCSLSIGVFSAFNNFTLALWLSTFTTSYLLISLFGNTRSFEGCLVGPLVGAWSDHTWLGRLGRRRPFILVGGLASALLLALTPAIGRLPAPGWLSWLRPDVFHLAPALASIFLFTLTFNAMGDTHEALLADITSGAERNRLAALRIVVNMAGQVGILVLGFFLWKSSVPDWAFLCTAALMAAGVLWTVARTKEPAPSAWSADRIVRERAAKTERAARPSVRAFLTEYRGATVFCLVVFAYWSGVNAVMPLVSIYTRDILGASVGEAQLLPALLLLSTTLLAVPMGWLGTRFGKRRVIGAGYAIMGLAALAGLVITNTRQGALVFLFAGVGNAGSQVLSLPLMADLVPRKHVGLATGALAAAGSVAAPLASLIAGGLADVYGPRVIFVVMSAMIGVALLLMPFVRRPSFSDEAAPEALAIAAPAMRGIEATA